MKAAKEALGKRKFYTSGRQNTKPWFTPKVKNLAAEKKKVISDIQKQLYHLYKDIRNKVNTEI